MDPELKIFAIEITKKIIPEIERIIKTYGKDPEEGMSTYFDFLKRVKPSLEKIIQGLRDPIDLGHISPRLLRDPLSIDLKTNSKSLEEKEAHVVGYLKAILFLVYCGALGLEGWQFKDTSLYEVNITSQNTGKINVIPTLVQIVKKEIVETDLIEQLKMDIEERERGKEKIFIDIDKTKKDFQKKLNFDHLYQPTDGDNTDIPFTARLMAYYRAQEFKNDSPLIVDPFAERLAGDLTSYANKHKFVSGRGDYPLVRSYYIEKNLLTPWCIEIEESQIVLLGAGLDTRAYRFKPLQTNKHTIFEIDFSNVISYKERILKGKKPLGELVRIPEDLSKPEWASHLIKSGFSTDIPTFWVLEGLVYYMEQEIVVSLLEKTAEMSLENSQIFVDICVPILAELVFGPFTKHFKWGLDKKDVPLFFAAVGWKVSVSFAEDHNQGRDVGQRGLMFIHGVRSIMV
ncbi:MAG: class I SAM-dependent methyltransferase [Candidatus Hodarchaeota archaeon]